MIRGLTGRAGEYAVASELSRRAWIATMTFGNAPGVDLLALHPTSKREIAIQVKTSSPNRDHFQLKPEHEDFAEAGSYWFVFVKLGDEIERPEFFVVPGDVVAAILYAVRLRHKEETGKPT